MEPAPVIQPAHTVYRNLQPLKPELLQKADVSIQIVAVGNGAQRQSHGFRMLADVPYRSHILFQQRLTAVKGAVSHFVALLPLLPERGEYRLHHFGFHFMTQPLLPPCQAVPFEAVWAAEIAIVSGQDHRSPAAVADQFAPNAAEQPRVGQFPRLILPGDMTTLGQPFPHGKRNCSKISFADLCRDFRIHHVNGTVQTVHKQRFAFDFRVVPSNQRQEYFICTFSHEKPPHINLYILYTKFSKRTSLPNIQQETVPLACFIFSCYQSFPQCLFRKTGQAVHISLFCLTEYR